MQGKSKQREINRFQLSPVNLEHEVISSIDKLGHPVIKINPVEYRHPHCQLPEKNCVKEKELRGYQLRGLKLKQPAETNQNSREQAW